MEKSIYEKNDKNIIYTHKMYLKVAIDATSSLLLLLFFF